LAPSGKKLDAAIPLGRMAKPEEIASVLAFLVGDGASHITATTIFADSGIVHGSPGCKSPKQSWTLPAILER
jgi:glucose 1-dehydrogenase